jgi:hypothetical protein
MHGQNFNYSRQKIKKAFEKAGAGNIKITSRQREGIHVSYTCPEESDRQDMDWQVCTIEFARRLYFALKEVGYPVERKFRIRNGYQYFLGSRVDYIENPPRHPIHY